MTDVATDKANSEQEIIHVVVMLDGKPQMKHLAVELLQYTHATITIYTR